MILKGVCSLCGGRAEGLERLTDWWHEGAECEGWEKGYFKEDGKVDWTIAVSDCACHECSRGLKFLPHPADTTYEGAARPRTTRSTNQS